MGKYSELKAYKLGFELAMEIYWRSTKFPDFEKYGLSSQIRRSTRSVCANLAEAYKRRRSENFFLSKLNDCEAENSETQVWLDFALSCKYLTQEEYDSFTSKNNEIGRLIRFMISNPKKFS